MSPATQKGTGQCGRFRGKRWRVKRDSRASSAGGQGFTSRLLSAGASDRTGASVRTEKEFVFFFFFFFKPGVSLHFTLTLRGFALEPPVLPVELVCTEVTPGSRARQRVNTRGDYGAVRANGLRL